MSVSSFFYLKFVSVSGLKLTVCFFMGLARDRMIAIANLCYYTLPYLDKFPIMSDMMKPALQYIIIMPFDLRMFLRRSSL